MSSIDYVVLRKIRTRLGKHHIGISHAGENGPIIALFNLTMLTADNALEVEKIICEFKGQLEETLSKSHQPREPDDGNQKD